MLEKINIQTSDGINVVGNLFGVENPSGWIIFLHSMQATKASYLDIARQFQEKGYEGLAIDFRGHGNSQFGPEGYLKFTEEDHQRKILDVESAVRFLESRGANAGQISIIGASIGSNLALLEASKNPKISHVVLLSPGLDYRGITTKNSVTRLTAGQRVLFVGSEDDNHTVESVNELFGLVPDGVFKDRIILTDAGHGTTMLERHPELNQKIIDFIINVK